MTIQQKRYFVWLVNHHLYFLARFLRSRFAWWPRSSLDLCWPYSAARQLLEPFMEICMLSTMLVVCQSWIQHWISNASIMSRNPIPKSMLWHAWPTIPRLRDSHQTLPQIVQPVFFALTCGGSGVCLAALPSSNYPCHWARVRASGLFLAELSPC